MSDIKTGASYKENKITGATVSASTQRTVWIANNISPLLGRSRRHNVRPPSTIGCVLLFLIRDGNIDRMVRRMHLNDDIVHSKVDLHGDEFIIPRGHEAVVACEVGADDRGLREGKGVGDLQNGGREVQCAGEAGLGGDDGRHAAGHIAGDVFVGDLEILEKEADELAAAGDRPVVKFVHGWSGL